MSVEIYRGKKSPYSEYKGFRMRINWDFERDIYIGKIEGFSEPVTFECDHDCSSTEIESKFYRLIDNYLESGEIPADKKN